MTTEDVSSLAKLRRRRGMTQVDVAEAMGLPQSSVSRLERQADLRVSTLRRYVSALGGRLHVDFDHDEAADSDLEHAIRVAIYELDAWHRPLPASETGPMGGCELCWPGDGHWPCAAASVAADLQYALEEEEHDG